MDERKAEKGRTDHIELAALGVDDGGGCVRHDCCAVVAFIV